MQKRYLNLIPLLVGTVLLGWSMFRSQPEADANYVLRINDTRFTRLELKALHEAMAREDSRSGNEALEALIEHELLYQEAIKRGLDRSDPVIRRRLIQLVLEQNEAAVPQPDDAELARFYQQNITRYTHPAAVRFDQWFLPHGTDPDLANRLQQQMANDMTPQAFANIRQKHSLQLAAHNPERLYSSEDLIKLYGDAFTTALFSQPIGQPALITSDLGTHWVWVSTSQPAATAALDNIRDRVNWEWREVERIRLNQALLRQLRDQADIDIRTAR